MKTFAFAIAALTTFAAPALAGGVAPEPVSPPLAFAPEYNWTGFSVGAQLGYSSSETTIRRIDGDGPAGGIRAYYDRDFGNYILGAGVQYDASSYELRNTGIGLEVEDILRLGVRAGLDGGRNFYYGTAGFARVNLDSAVGGTDSNGYFVGGGYEVFVTESLTAGAEVLYHEFDDFPGGGNVSLHTTTAAVSVNFRF